VIKSLVVHSCVPGEFFGLRKALLIGANYGNLEKSFLPPTPKFHEPKRSHLLSAPVAQNRAAGLTAF
jgi:hypothetical protein